MAKTQYQFVAVHVPDVSKGAAVRKKAWSALGKLRQSLIDERRRPGSTVQQVWAGGLEFAFGPTIELGNSKFNWQIYAADAHRPLRSPDGGVAFSAGDWYASGGFVAAHPKKGTYQQTVSRRWFELDVMVASPSLLPLVNSVTKFTSAITDHHDNKYFMRFHVHSLDIFAACGNKFGTHTSCHWRCI